MKKTLFLSTIMLIVSSYGYSHPKNDLEQPKLKMSLPTQNHGSKTVEEIKQHLTELRENKSQITQKVPPPVKISPQSTITTKETAVTKSKNAVTEKFLSEKIKVPQQETAEKASERKSKLVAEIRQVLQQSEQVQEQEAEKPVDLPTPQIKKALPSVAAIKDFIHDQPSENEEKKSEKTLANTQQPPKNSQPKTVNIKNARQKIIANGKKLIGTPYLFGGSTRAGFDCSGLVQYLYKQQGINVPRTSRHQFSELKPVKEPQPGDLVFFRHGNRPVNHVGLYIGDNKMLHAPSTGKKVQIVDIDTKYWKRRYAGARQALGNHH